MQHTIQKEAALEGIGIHSGKKVSLVLKPNDVNKGIVFKRTDFSPAKIISLEDFEFAGYQRRTAITSDGAEVHTVEHLMAALWALSIDNIIIETTDAEMPALDGSAKEYYNALKTAGVKEQEGRARSLKITEPVWIERGEAFLGVFPSSSFRLSYMLESPSPAIRKQSLTIEPNQEVFEKEIAPARTFCLKEEAQMLLKMGFGKGANTKNTLVMSKDGPIDNTLRFRDEPVRHKILDLIGDLYLSCARIEGRVIALRSGHDLNIEIVKRLRQVSRP